MPKISSRFRAPGAPGRSQPRKKCLSPPSNYRRLAREAAIRLERRSRRRVPREALRVSSARLRELTTALRVIEQCHDRLDELADVSRIDQQCGVTENFR